MRKHSNINRNKKYGDYPRPVGIGRNNSLHTNKSRKSKYLLAGLTTFSLAFVVAYIASAEFMGIDSSDASTTIHTSISSGDYYLNLTSLGEVNIDLNATTSGNTSTANDTITVNTNTSGYKLYISTDNTDTNSNKMYLNGNSSSGYSINPVDVSNINNGGSASNGFVSELSTNSWGFSVDNGNSYSMVPIKGNESLFATKTGLTAGTDSTNNHTITYGVKADLGLPAGNYSATVSYSAIADASSVSNLASVYPNEVERASSGTYTLTVTIPMMTNMETGSWTVSITPTTGSSTDETECTSPTATKKADGSGVTITCTAPKTLTAGTYTVTVKSDKYGSMYTASNALKYKQPAIGIYTIDSMQNISSTICSQNTTPSANATLFDTDGSHHGDTNYVPQTILTDTRDNKKYVIQKMPDGKCWMMQNLAIDPGVLPADKTNITSDYVLPDSASFSSNTTASVKTGSHIDGSLTSNGNWYSFVAATAGTGNNVSSNGEQAPEDICPKNWRLPNGGGSGEFQALYNYYGNKTKFDVTWQPVYAGIYGHSSHNGGGSDGRWWSRTSKSGTLAYIHEETTSGNISPADNSTRYDGYSVRCIAQ